MAEYRGYNIDGDGTFGMKIIKPTTRGSVPGELRGSFTTEYFAKRTIDQFLNAKEVKDGKVSINA
jgi:hypothetical protein